MQSKHGGLVELEDHELALVSGGQAAIPIELTPGTIAAIVGPGGTATAASQLGQVTVQASQNAFAFVFLAGLQGIKFSYPV